ncbi:MAG: hypothetical protein COV07_02320 [Candidatus Vogelbacteria bacterium CG10_big_fil_rev_8_21_14_0_10_45_14]|uniref:Type II toxin-antitoxin system antitoxin, RelB/DinJ family n=1 Tax=Candidatus Vogelbacteria bacterium CG10_big_fil_rev_8_21_14_0_10_45_14 TaxID=1975042 RepID=A0A2H0RJX3_9BACT|nr:MAG: hypothetical protein COV07_02320 [Candidatus Vogelbacteria bacterium CG10_big_fil_rev_8_21_14_0_10_45_14]
MKAQDTASEMGVPLSAVVNEQLRQFVVDRSLTFRAPLVPNGKTARILRKRLLDIDKGKNIVGPFRTAKEADEWLDG